MKKYVVGVGLGLLISQSLFFAGAQTVDTSLEDKINEQNFKELKIAQNHLKFEAFESCEDMNTILEESIKKFKLQYPRYYGGGPIMMEGDIATDAAMEDSKETTAVPLAPQVGGGEVDEFSTTNLQKEGVDEPEILKSNGDYIFYYNQQEARIYIMKTPLNVATKDVKFDRAAVVSEIVIPSKMYSTQMFLQGSTLIVVGARYIDVTFPHTLIDKHTRTVVASYDVSNPSKPTLDQFHDIDGGLNNMRMIGDKVYVLTDLPINLWNATQYDTEVTVDMDEAGLPKVYSVDSEKNLTVNTTDCSQISYVLPSDDTVDQNTLYPQFSMVSVIDLGETSVETTVAYGTPGEIHMTTDSLYMVQNYWIPDGYYYTCPLDAMCIMPRFMGGQNYSLVHKFSLGEKVLYEDSNIVPGNLLTQYSMDEDAEGNFRMLTSVRFPEQATNLYVLDKGLELVGQLPNIEPGEQFRASRYIGDKLYLVTFQQTDPLFVIDIANPAKPTIIGELKIPGFSTYLHPMGTNQNGIQYLIGMGYDADVDGRQKGLQVSLFKVDYNQKETVDSRCGTLSAYPDLYNACKTEVNPNNIRVSQVDVMTLGEEGSRSEATYNPRMFVMNANNEVTFPMLLKKKVTGAKDCNISYDANGNVVGENCYDVDQYVTTFAGLKSLKFDATTGITEVASQDYQEQLKRTIPSYDNRYNQGVDSRQMQQLMMRVGFLGSSLYSVNNDFAHFFDKTQESFINFDPILNGEQVVCAGKDQLQCESAPQCQGVYGSSNCTGEVCTTDYVFQQCVNK